MKNRKVSNQSTKRGQLAAALLDTTALLCLAALLAVPTIRFVGKSVKNAYIKTITEGGGSWESNNDEGDDERRIGNDPIENPEPPGGPID